MPHLMCKTKYFSPPAGGGVRGRVIGIVPVTMTEAGLHMEVYHLSKEVFLRDGEIITEPISGKASPGIKSGYLIMTCSAIGVDGRETGTGKRIPGEYRDYSKNAGLTEIQEIILISNSSIKENFLKMKKVILNRE